MTPPPFSSSEAIGIATRQRKPMVASVLTLFLVMTPVWTGCGVISPTRVDSMASWPAGAAVTRGEPPTPMSLPEGPLTLERALEVALARNPDVAAGTWDIKAAQARRRYASSKHLPSLDIDIAYRHNWHEERLVPPREQGSEAAFSHDIFSADMALRIPLFSGGRVVSAVAAQEFLAKSAEHRLERTRGELVFNIKSAFYETLGQEKLIEATERSRGALNEHLRVTKVLVEEGKAANVDLLNLEGRLAELDSILVEQRGHRDLSTHLLVSLMGVNDTPTKVLAITGELEEREVSLDGEELLSKALEARPEVGAITGELEAQAKLVDVARAEYWPDISAQVTYGARLSAQAEADDLGFAGVDLSFPALAAIGTSARVREERAKLGALSEQRRKLVAVIRREVESAIIHVETAIAQVKSTERAIPLARESLRIEREKTALGRGTTREVLDAQAALQGAESRAYSALVDLHTSLALLELAVGAVP